MQYYYADSLDAIDAGYNVRDECYSSGRVRGRTDVFAHEVVGSESYDGMLLSYAMAWSGRFSEPMRQRLYREGMRRFYRLPPEAHVMGDSGAYSTTQRAGSAAGLAEVLAFYDAMQVDAGMAPDVLVPGIAVRAGRVRPLPEAMWRAAYTATLEAANAFLRLHRQERRAWEPIGVAQGWNVPTYVDAVQALERMGYRTIALGGLASAPTGDLRIILRAVSAVRKPTTRFHLLGVAREEAVYAAAAWGVASFDSAMPTRQAFKEDRHNYHFVDDDPALGGRGCRAIRIPQATRAIGAHERAAAVGYVAVARAEARALDALWDLGEAAARPQAAVEAILAYGAMTGVREDADALERVLRARPWDACPCPVCQRWGIGVMLFRSSEHNKRRAFHNLWVFAQRRADAPAREGPPDD